MGMFKVQISRQHWFMLVAHDKESLLTFGKGIFPVFTAKKKKKKKKKKSQQEQ